MLSKKEDSTMKMTRRNFLSASALTLLSCQLAPAARADCLLSGLSTAQTPPCRRSL